MHQENKPWTHSQGLTTPKVTLQLRDSVYEFGPRQLSDDEVWNVATIQWPSMTVIPGGAPTGQPEELLYQTVK